MITLNNVQAKLDFFFTRKHRSANFKCIRGVGKHQGFYLSKFYTFA